MKTPHKHAELIKAWADGAVIQYHTDCIEWEDIESPSWHEETKYRIKPEPKPDEVIFVCAAKNWVTYSESRHADHNLQLIFDGETGALKAAEVLK